MATNLNPGADATLVQAAYAASMANVPKDLSGTFEALSESYADTMKTVGEQWGEAIKTTAGLATIAVNGAIAHNQQMGALGDHAVLTAYSNLNTNSVDGQGDGMYTTLGDEFRRIRDEIWQSRKEDPFGREGRRKRYKLKQEKDQILSDLAVLENADNFSNDLLINGLVDKSATGALRLAMKNALHAYKTKSGVIQEGEYKGYKAVLMRDANDKLTFVLQDPNGKSVTGLNSVGKLTTDGDKPFSVSVDKMGSLITEKMDDTTKANIDKLFTNQVVSGKIKGSTYMRNKLINDLKPFVDNETSLHQIINLALGDNATSWVEDLNNPSVSSATIFRAMTALSVGGGTDKNIIDAIDANADGKAELTKEDFMGANGAENYNLVKQALLDRDSKYYNEDVTRNEFLQYAGDVGDTMYKYGVGMRPKDTKGDDDGDDKKNYGFVSSYTNQHVNDDVVRDKAKQMYNREKGRTISLWDQEYEVLVKGKKYKGQDGEIYTFQQVWDKNEFPSGLEKDVVVDIEEEANLPVNQDGDTVENGAYLTLFTMDDDDAVPLFAAMFPPNYAVTTGASAVGKFFGSDKIQVFDESGTEIEGSPFHVGYDDSMLSGGHDLAAEEARRFNTVAAKHFLPIE